MFISTPAYRASSKKKKKKNLLYIIYPLKIGTLWYGGWGEGMLSLKLNVDSAAPDIGPSSLSG